MRKKAYAAGSASATVAAVDASATSRLLTR